MFWLEWSANRTSNFASINYVTLYFTYLFSLSVTVHIRCCACGWNGSPEQFNGGNCLAFEVWNQIFAKSFSRFFFAGKLSKKWNLFSFCSHCFTLRLQWDILSWSLDRAFSLLPQRTLKLIKVVGQKILMLEQNSNWNKIN